MIAIFGAILGFFSSVFPDLLKLLQDRRDKAHELRILDLQMQQQAQGHTERLAEIEASFFAEEMKRLAMQGKNDRTGIRWVDALNASVRPVIAYAFFLVYAAVKAMQWQADLPWLLWTDEDKAIFAAIISFYFGSRAMSQRARKG